MNKPPDKYALLEEPHDRDPPSPMHTAVMSLGMVAGLAGVAYLVNSIENDTMRNLAPILAVFVIGSLWNFIKTLLGIE